MGDFGLPFIFSCYHLTLTKGKIVTNNSRAFLSTGNKTNTLAFMSDIPEIEVTTVDPGEDSLLPTGKILLVYQ